jgi:hypothetical protein
MPARVRLLTYELPGRYDVTGRVVYLSSLIDPSTSAVQPLGLTRGILGALVR